MSEPEEPGSGDWSALRWILLGLVGIVLAVAIALAAANLIRQPVGLAGEPVSAGSALEPAVGAPGRTVAPKPAATNPRPDQASKLPGSNGPSDQHGDDEHHKDDDHPENDHHSDDEHHKDDDD
ncbi:MAG: hypothetical protein M9938_08840 [Solirubrobacterales bacterium]|nr:hypothetical protein [Solirubrobacterales bacterium]